MPLAQNTGTTNKLFKERVHIHDIYTQASLSKIDKDKLRHCTSCFDVFATQKFRQSCSQIRFGFSSKLLQKLCIFNVSKLDGCVCKLRTIAEHLTESLVEIHYSEHLKRTEIRVE